MKNLSLASLLFFATTVTTLSHAQTPPPAKAFHYSTIDALLAGAYEGELTVDELKLKGDFGIGTFNRVDGEMIVLDGEVFQFKADGSVVKASGTQLTPFAVVTRFNTDFRYDISKETSMKELEDMLDQRLDNKNLFYAIRVEGDFKQLTTRAIAPQDKPYKPLAEVTKTQTLFNYTNTKGVLVGFRSPGFAKGFNVPGYHWHYLSNDHKAGGHVLALSLSHGAIKVGAVSDIEIKLPTNDQFATTNQTLDRSKELKAVEGLRKD
ncbi:acetolactate decarboxylase [Undibacterium sp. Ji49W]|uniref:acetolactate decarboxylase n=1 Tax=Undibacterium sp. Ji49W TaxID=3413040 RepID=UPI003BEF8D31